MDLHKMIAELQAEKQRLDEAIVALERLSAGKVRRRGKHPDSAKDEDPAESAFADTLDDEDLPEENAQAI